MLKIESKNHNYYLYDQLTNKIYKVTNEKKLLKHKNENLKSVKSFKLLTFNYESDVLPYDNLLLIIEITQNCNLRCSYCVYSGKYSYNRKHNNKSISYSTIEKALEKFFLLPSKNKGITFYGGEPLLEKNLILKTIENVRNNFDNNVLFNISTNGYLLDIDFFKQIWQILGTNFCFSVSLDGPTNIHDRYRRTINKRPTHIRIIKNLKSIKNLIDKQFSNHFQFICTLHPPFSLEEIEKFFENELFNDCNLKVGVMNIYDTALLDEFNFYYHLPTYHKQYRTLAEKYMNKIINNEKPSLFTQSLFEKSIRKIHNRLMNPPLYDTHSGACRLGERIFCSSDGILYPCEKNTSSFFKIGDVDNGISFPKIKKIEKKWVNLINRECNQCFAVRMCSLCYIHAIKENYFDLDRMRINCEAERKNLEFFLYMYVSIMEENPNSLDFLREEKK